MKIAVVGRGNIGGGLADFWERAGHEVTRIGRDGGNVTDRDAVLLAVPGGAVAEAFDTVGGWEGKTVIDATNLFGAQQPDGFASNAEFVKWKTTGPTAKSFNLNFARLSGYDPVFAGGLETAAVQEGAMALFGAISQANGVFFYRIAPPDEF